MSQIFQYKYLTDIDLEDPFFDSLRKDYDGFNAWYKRKESEKRKAFVLYKYLSHYIMEVCLFSAEDHDDSIQSEVLCII